MSRCVRKRAVNMLVFQTQIERFTKLLEHDERELKADELVTLSNVMYQKFGIVFNTINILQFKARELPDRLKGKSLSDQYATVNIAVCQYLKLLKSLTVSEAYIERLFCYLGRATENGGRDSLKLVTFQSLCYLKINGTWKKQQRSSHKQNKNKKYENKIIYFQNFSIFSVFSYSFVIFLQYFFTGVLYTGINISCKVLQKQQPFLLISKIQHINKINIV
ncbi:Hypothetical_protein [Hexamita inflata]|uniref:Hypothetical_protein n=1 Tax=Hexamita inflata TaxID=28002 RepID=A0AA86RA30_9EUKA|nr:Hypothetical protein HINF_LOCUS61836 [Hexamita inflata]